MGRVGLLVACVLVLVPLAGCATPPPRDPGAVPLKEGTGGLLGNVVANDGRSSPLANATVLVQPGGGMHVTDHRGKFEVRGLPPGEYTVRASLSGYEGNPKPARIVAGEYYEVVVFMDRLRST